MRSTAASSTSSQLHANPMRVHSSSGGGATGAGPAAAPGASGTVEGSVVVSESPPPHPSSAAVTVAVTRNRPGRTIGASLGVISRQARALAGAPHLSRSDPL